MGRKGSNQTNKQIILVNFISSYTSTTTSKAWPSIYSMHLPLQSRLKAFGGSVVMQT